MPPRRRAAPARDAPGRLRSSAGRHRVLATFLVVLTVLVAGAAVALPVVDSAARERAADRIAAQAQRELGLRSPPLVQIGSSWFLWQAARGRFDGATIRTARLTYDGADLGATRVRLRDVGVPRSVLLGGAGTVTVAGGDVRTTAPWALVSARATEEVGSPVVLRRQGRQVLATVTLAGIPLEVLMRPRVSEDAIVLRPTDVQVGGRTLGLAAASDLADRFGVGDTADSLLSGFSYDLDAEAEDFDVRTVSATDEGLAVGGALKPLELPVGG